MAIAPFNLLKEASVHQNNGILNPLQRLTIDGRCPIVTLWHKIINRAQELHRGDRRFGSTGMGVGATFIYARSHPNTTLTAWDLVDHRRLSEKVDALEQCLLSGNTVLEGAQGTLLDYQVGTVPLL